MLITTGGKNMSAARTFCIVISLLSLLVITVYIGCAPDRTGTAAANQKPEANFTNTPPDSAQFSRNPELSWYGTDDDGFIVFFRYAVVVDSMMLIGGNHVPPEIFVEQATDAQFGWDTLPVDLDHPQAQATVRLHANTESPVDSFVTQYVFIQAQDDRGAMSDIKWRMYSRNNHFPNTSFTPNTRSRRHYINAVDANSPAPGINISWEGADSADWGRAEAPLEYEWRLFGPFEEDAIIYVNLVPENCVYDPILDSFVACIDFPVLDLDNLPPALNDLSQPIIHSQGPNFANDPSDVWVTETQVTIYDAYRELNLEKTSKYRFVFWVRSRDDGFVPDPTPSFKQFDVYEAKFENSIMIIDETGYDTRNGRWGPTDMDTVKAYFYNAIREAGYLDFDTTYHLTPLTGPEHYFYEATKKNAQNDSLPFRTLYLNIPKLINVLAHQVIIFYNDDAEPGPKEGTFGLMKHVFDGLDMGASAWMLSRNLGDAALRTPRGVELPKSLNFSTRFGISMVVCEGWLDGIFENPMNPTFNEEFIGAYSNIAGFPHLMVDLGEGSLLDMRYPRLLYVDPTHVMTGLPEIGVGTRTSTAAPVYLYLSKYGDESFFHGKVMSVMQQLGDMRTACFMFTPLAIDPEPMQEMFNFMLPWLAAKFETSQKPLVSGVPAYQSSWASIPERRARLQRFLDYVAYEATDEEKTAWGMQDQKPFVVKPADNIE
jgi:hypothetical protein